MHLLPNISRSKGSQTMKFGQLIEYNTRNIFSQKSCRKAVRLVLDLFLFSQKASNEVKATGLQLSFNVLIALNLAYNKNKNFRILIQRYAELRFFRKASGTSFSTTFCVWFFKKKVSYIMFY